MNGGGVLLLEKDFLRVAALVDSLLRNQTLRQAVIKGQLKALEKYSRENISRILLDHLEEVIRK
jgi:hypothetical protein